MVNCLQQQTAIMPIPDPARSTNPARQRPRTTGPVPTVLGVPTPLSLWGRNGGEKVTPSHLTRDAGRGRTRQVGTPAHHKLFGELICH